jgi:hypothetical protein
LCKNSAAELYLAALLEVTLVEKPGVKAGLLLLEQPSDSRVCEQMRDGAEASVSAAKLAGVSWWQGLG